MATVHFPQTPAPVCTSNGTVAFPVVIDGWATMAEISAEALRDHFRASDAPDGLLAAFQWHRPAIEAIARMTLPDRRAGGRALLVSADFDRWAGSLRRVSGQLADDSS
jgi:predicted nucleic acid-binding Zn ribbon protein